MCRGSGKSPAIAVAARAAKAIEKGEQALRQLLPRESVSKFCDLALLTLIYPFMVTTEAETLEILKMLNTIW